MILCLCSKSIHSRYCAILFEEPRKSAHNLFVLHINDYTLIRFEIRIAAADSIRDSIRTKISDSQVPTDSKDRVVHIKKSD